MRAARPNKKVQIHDANELLALAGVGNIAAALGNWASIDAVIGQTVAPGVHQAAPTNSGVAAIALIPRVTGIFLVGCQIDWSDATTADNVAHTLVGKQAPSSAGVLAGTGAVASAKVGAGTVVNGVATASGFMLTSDEGAGPGVTYNGADLNTFTTQYAQDTAGTLTGLLKTNGLGTQTFGFMGICDANGSSSLTKLPFVLGQSCCFGVYLNAADTVWYQSLSLWAVEIPFG